MSALHACYIVHVKSSDDWTNTIGIVCCLHPVLIAPCRGLTTAGSLVSNHVPASQLLLSSARSAAHHMGAPPPHPPLRHIRLRLFNAPRTGVLATGDQMDILCR
jgi:hypothetical protein